MQVEGKREDSLLSSPSTGARVSNAYPTCHPAEDSLSKERIILHDLLRGHLTRSKDSSLGDGDASD